MTNFFADCVELRIVLFNSIFPNYPNSHLNSNDYRRHSLLVRTSKICRGNRILTRRDNLVETNTIIHGKFYSNHCIGGSGDCGWRECRSGEYYKYLSWVYGVDRKICHEGCRMMPNSDPE